MATINVGCNCGDDCSCKSSSVTYWHWCSDLQLNIQLYYNSKAYPVGDDDNFKLIFFTNGRRKFVCERIDGVCDNCVVNDDGTITCYIDKPHFAPGTLRVKAFYIMDNDNFDDGNYTVCSEVALPIVIVKDNLKCTNDSVDVNLIIPYALADLYDLAVANGYNGTEEEFWQDLLNALNIESSLAGYLKNTSDTMNGSLTVTDSVIMRGDNPIIGAGYIYVAVKAGEFLAQIPGQTETQVSYGISVGGNLFPSEDNKYYLGGSDCKWKVVYAKYGSFESLYIGDTEVSEELFKGFLKNTTDTMNGVLSITEGLKLRATSDLGIESYKEIAGKSFTADVPGSDVAEVGTGVSVGSHLFPTEDNTYVLGGKSNRWKGIWAVAAGFDKIVIGDQEINADNISNIVNAPKPVAGSYIKITEDTDNKTFTISVTGIDNVVNDGSQNLITSGAVSDVFVNLRTSIVELEARLSEVEGQLTYATDDDINALFD